MLGLWAALLCASLKCFPSRSLELAVCAGAQDELGSHGEMVCAGRAACDPVVPCTGTQALAQPHPEPASSGTARDTAWALSHSALSTVPRWQVGLSSSLWRLREFPGDQEHSCLASVCSSSAGHIEFTTQRAGSHMCDPEAAGAGLVTLGLCQDVPEVSWAPRAYLHTLHQSQPHFWAGECWKGPFPPLC